MARGRPRKYATEAEAKAAQREQQARWHKEHRSTRSIKTDLSWRSAWIQRKYGITIDDYNQMMEAQDGRCAICRELPAPKRNGLLCIDHDHMLEGWAPSVRGLLCHRCNLGISFMEGPFF